MAAKAIRPGFVGAALGSISRASLGAVSLLGIERSSRSERFCYYSCSQQLHSAEASQLCSMYTRLAMRAELPGGRRGPPIMAPLPFLPSPKFCACAQQSLQKVNSQINWTNRKNRTTKK